jgi:uncharacterized membrane protein
MANPCKPTIKSEIWPWLMIVISFALSFYFYANFPEKVPTHWNIYGQPDAWSGRAFGAFFFPFLILGLYLLFLGFPYLDPKKERYEQFSHVYHVFKGLLVAFLAGLYLFTGLVSFGWPAPVNVYVPAAIGLLFIIMGNYFGKLKTNWFIGIRTPWTLSNEEVWSKTHRLGGKLYVIFGFLTIIGAIVLPPVKVFIYFIILLIIVTFWPMVYSYLLFRKIKK